MGLLVKLLALSLALPVPAYAGHKCTEEAVNGVCDCEHWSFSGYQCSGCKDKNFWGYGCDMECNVKCVHGCDFIGDCLKPYQDKCKRNNRWDANPTSRKEKYNDQGDCQNCEDHYWGRICDMDCPANCDESPEGFCSRSGKCYSCKLGWFGEDCSKPCPEGCPECVMVDTDEKPAGSCKDDCENDMFKSDCSKPCPDNCRKNRVPSCDKDSGKCFKCKDKMFWGDSCEHPCSKGCLGQECYKENGECRDDCEIGYYGRKCDQECSENCKDRDCHKVTGKCLEGCETKGQAWWGSKCENKCPDGYLHDCDEKTGMPDACVEGKYPDIVSRTNRTFICRSCPPNCKNGKCDQYGICTEGCNQGYHGDTCYLPCPPGCVGPCDAKTTNDYDGYCLACIDGKTGKQCTKSCHPTCKACRQRNDGVSEKSCTKCKWDQPTELKTFPMMQFGTCECIHNAKINATTSLCECTTGNLDDPQLVGFFENVPYKLCKIVCKDELKLVLGEKDSTCMSNSVYKAVVRAEMIGLEQGECEEGHYQIKVKKENQCIRKDYVDYILKA